RPRIPGQCKTGDAQCCNSTSLASNPVTALFLRTLGIVVDGVGIIVGITCSPIDLLAIGGATCSQQPVCCTNNSFNGVVNIGCAPISL
ncbi:hypothetical protein M422DRAFT_196074, partial [Sphaerobolus stellatus SS14]